MMKRVRIFTKMILLTALICVCLTGCGKSTAVTLPFEAADVARIEMYRFVVPASAEKKEITEPEEIADVYSTFSNLKVTDKETEPLTGSTVTSFRFRLLDGTSYEIIYNAEGVKSGRVQLGEETKDYFTSADIGSLWENCQEEAVKVDEAELPAYP